MSPFSSGSSQKSKSQYRLRVPQEKNTSGGGGKPRDAYLPDDVEHDLQQFQNPEYITPRDSCINLSERGDRAAVKRTAETAADQTGENDFRHVSSRDLRRRFAQRLLVDEQINPRVVIEVGGWSSFQAIELSLNAPSEEGIDGASQ